VLRTAYSPLATNIRMLRMALIQPSSVRTGAADAIPMNHSAHAVRRSAACAAADRSSASQFTPPH